MYINSDEKNRKLQVVMFGPNRFVNGGVSNVVNNWIETGLGEITQLHYISTLEISSPKQYFYKFLNAVKAYLDLIIEARNHTDIIHIHMASNMSFFRKLVIFKYSKWKNIKTIIHIHGAEFDLFFNNSNKFISPVWFFISPI